MMFDESIKIGCRIQMKQQMGQTHKRLSFVMQELIFYERKNRLENQHIQRTQC